VYYRIYEKHGAVLSKQPADSTKPFVGRINVDSIPPPHTAKSIVRCVSRIEGLDQSKQLQLFSSISHESPIDEGHVSILTRNYPGSTPDDPLALMGSQISVAVPVPPSKYSKRLRVTRAAREA
jgi:hypothetical protein